MRAYRWSDNDRYFGPFTYAKDGNHSHWAITLRSDDDEERGCTLRFSGFGRTLVIALPPVIRPWKENFARVEDHRPDVRARIGDFYYHTHVREFGISLSGSGRADGTLDFVQVMYGAQTHSSLTEMRKGYFLPWVCWRHVRHSLYDLDGKHFADMPDQRRMLETWKEREAIQNACPARVFPFLDFDDETIEATCRIEEREWRRGEGRWKWLSWFYQPNISRVLDIRFSKETGKRKGSWKGGTVGHSIEMLPGELHESAFRRYCAEHDMTFIGKPSQAEPVQ